MRMTGGRDQGREEHTEWRPQSTNEAGGTFSGTQCELVSVGAQAYYMYSADVMLSNGLAVKSRSLWVKRDSKLRSQFVHRALLILCATLETQLRACGRLAMKIRYDMFVQSPTLALGLLCHEMKEVVHGCYTLWL